MENLSHEKAEREINEAAGDDYTHGGTNSENDIALKGAINAMNVDVMLQKVE
jgi:hypothetical protein